MFNKADVVGVWDFSSTDNRLGSLFIFIRELEACPQKNKYIGIKNYSDKFESYIDVIKCFSSHQVYFLNQSDDSDFPSIFHDSQNQYCTSRIGSMQWIAYLYTDKSILSEIKSKCRVSNINLNNRVSVALHLKNNPLDLQSNAEQLNWLQALKEIYSHCPEIQFVLVGDEEVLAEFYLLPNLMVYNGKVADYFSIVCETTFFMGMSSAFCSAAILGNRPYRIWKHKGHHTEEMKVELDEAGQFPFRKQNQKLIIGKDSVPSIVREFNAMVEQHRRLSGV